MNLKLKIQQFISGDKTHSFEELALELFVHQYNYNSLYREFVDILGINPNLIKDSVAIPHMPISFFKTREVRTEQWKAETVFLSSGTSDMVERSHHYIKDLEWCRWVSARLFEQFYNDRNIEILGLLPSYVENGQSSLVFMIDNLMQSYNSELDAYCMYDFLALSQKIENLLTSTDKQIYLWGVSFALLDFAERHCIKSDRLRIIFTGGMKNKRKEMRYEDIYSKLKASFPLSPVDSEYGMTELMSQAYAVNNKSGVFVPGRSLRIHTRDITDPLSPSRPLKTGQIAFTDLANIDSSAFVLTDDIGVVYPDDSFIILGRLSNSDIRGCHLLYQRSAANMPS